MGLEDAVELLGDEDVRATLRVVPLPRAVIGLEDVSKPSERQNAAVAP